MTLKQRLFVENGFKNQECYLLYSTIGHFKLQEVQRDIQRTNHDCKSGMRAYSIQRICLAIRPLLL